MPAFSTTVARPSTVPRAQLPHPQVCALDGVDLDRSESRRRRMQYLNEAMSSGRYGAPELARIVEERLMLMRREGLPRVAGHADMLVAMEALRASGDYKGASRWALRAADCVRIGAGPSDPVHKQLKELARLLMTSAGVDAQRYQF
jgi:hypothetical protein